MRELLFCIFAALAVGASVWAAGWWLICFGLSLECSRVKDRQGELINTVGGPYHAIPAIVFSLLALVLKP